VQRFSRPGKAFVPIVILALALAACAPAAAPSPTAAPAKPAAQPTAAPAKPTEAPAAKPAPTAAPAKAEAKPAASPAAKAEAQPAASPAAKAEAKPALSKAEGPAASPAAKAAPAGKPEDLVVPKPSGSLAFRIAYASELQFVHIPTRMTADRLNTQGWTIENVHFAQSELATEAVVKREAVMGAGASVSALRATQAGSPTPIFVEYYRNALVLAAKKEITKCEDLIGARLAIHSEGAVATAQLRSWLGRACKPNPNWLIIPGSPNRATALLAGQIDATPMFLSDWVRIKLEAADRFHFIVNFADALPEVKANVHFADPRWLEQSRPVAVAFTAELLKTHRMLAANPKLLEDAVRRLLPELEANVVPEMVKENMEQEVFAVNGGLTTADVEGTAKFFEGTGELKPLT
jgi:NitT/TauT family transport system substrate-binding protein